MTRNQRTGTKKMAKPRDSVLMKKQPGAAGNLQKTPKPVRARKNPARTMRILHRKAGIRMRKKETEPDDDTIESGETNENEDETYA